MSTINESPSDVAQASTITRLFDAPRELVWQAWTEPQQVARWWGPSMFAVPLCEMDLRPGGAITIHMRGPDGTIYPSSGVFEEIVAPERLVFTSGAFQDEHGNHQLEARHTLTFAEQEGKTRLTLQAVVLKATPEVEGALAGMEEGWNQSLDRLAGELGSSTLRSKDGTAIAFDRSGSGPALVLVASALSDRSDAARLAELLAGSFTVFNYDRRGRGASGDTQPYAVEREIEDIEALIDAAGGTAYVFGSSSGAALALEAAARLPDKIGKAVLFEPPFIVDDSRPPAPADYVARVRALVSEDRRDAAVALFMGEMVGVPEEFLAGMRNHPSWAMMERAAHTLAYDGMIMGDRQSGVPLPADRWSAAGMPILVLDGAESPPFLHNAARAAADVLPDGRHRSLEGQDHSAVVTAPQALAPVLVEFFGA